MLSTSLEWYQLCPVRKSLFSVLIQTATMRGLLNIRTYDHDGETKIVVPQSNKQPRGGKRCQKTMKPKKTPTPLPTISQPNVRLIENEVSVNVHFVLNFALVCFTFCTQCSFSYVAYLSHFAITQKKKVLSRYHLGQLHYLKPFSERC